MSLPLELRSLIAQRDQGRCAYCMTAEQNCGFSMHIDHIDPESVGGSSTAENLCLACFSCNTYKGTKQAWSDPLTNAEVRLFHPLRQQWHDHFQWDVSGTLILGRTACGRATVAALRMNHPTIVFARRRWVAAGWHPPKD